MLSDTVGERVTTWRKRRGLSREELAEECARLGVPRLTAESFTNIESGRRKDGVRRRMVTVDELAVVARALNVPPVLLLVPYPDQFEVDLLPVFTTSAVTALKWWTGVDSPFPGSHAEDSIPIRMLSVHEQFCSRLLVLINRFVKVADELAEAIQFPSGPVRSWSRLFEVPGDDSGDEMTVAADILRTKKQALSARIGDVESKIVHHRAMMSHLNFPLPELPDQITYLAARTEKFMDNHSFGTGLTPTHVHNYLVSLREEEDE